MLTDPRQIRRELGVEADSVLIVCAARLEPEKDVRTLVNAMAGVAIAHPTAVCAISGDGSQRQELQELARRALPERNVRFLGFREDVMSIINAADLFVLPSPAEPFGLVLLEAMALGKAVVATRAGGPREIVVDRGTGLLIAPGQAHEMADAICQLLSDEKARCRMGECGRDLYLQEFTTGRMAKQTILVYEQALTRKKCAPTLNVPVAS
jgi:glycosyltransferase involved in cell wall biosynthesis